MAEPVNIEKEDIQKVREIQSKFQQNMLEFGQLYLEKMEIEKAIQAVTKKESDLKKSWEIIQNEENVFIDSIIKKYGEGTLDLNKEVLIPTE